MQLVRVPGPPDACAACVDAEGQQRDNSGHGHGGGGHEGGGAAVDAKVQQVPLPPSAGNLARNLSALHPLAKAGRQAGGEESKDQPGNSAACWRRAAQVE